MPLQNKTVEIDPSSTTQFDGKYNVRYRGEKYMKMIEADTNVEIKVNSINFVYGVNGGRRSYKFQIEVVKKTARSITW